MKEKTSTRFALISSAKQFITAGGTFCPNTFYCLGRQISSAGKGLALAKKAEAFPCGDPCDGASPKQDRALTLGHKLSYYHHHPLIHPHFPPVFGLSGSPIIRKFYPPCALYSHNRQQGLLPPRSPGSGNQTKQNKKPPSVNLALAKAGWSERSRKPPFKAIH